jgi:hypothetical protein
MRENLWSDTDYMGVLVDDYNKTPHNAFYTMFTPFQVQFTKDLEYKLEKIN